MMTDRLLNIFMAISGIFAVGMFAFVMSIDIPNERWTAPCTVTLQRLMAADTLVELEREKFLLGEMGCHVSREIRDLRSTP